jgi:DNA replication protein DnaC
MLAGDGANRVLNRNNGITETKYYQREMYREGFRNIFERLKADGVFTRSIPEIENSDLFKLSPFKALTEDQATSVEEIVKGFLIDVERGAKSMIVIQGDPGTGKTVVAIYMIKLLVDIKTFTSLEDLDSDSRFSNFFTETNQRLLQISASAWSCRSNRCETPSRRSSGRRLDFTPQWS